MAFFVDPNERFPSTHRAFHGGYLGTYDYLVAFFWRSRISPGLVYSLERAGPKNGFL